MKHPLFILAISAIATFTMGWFGHRVFLNSQQPEKISSQIPTPSLEKDSLIHLTTDAQLVKTFDSSSIKLTTPDSNSSTTIIVQASAKTDTLWDDEKEIVIKTPDGSVEILRKFRPLKSFKDFIVTEKFKKKPVTILDFSTSKYGKLYKTETKKSLASGQVFAGHYSFTCSDCGLGCFASTIVDLKTGNVYDGPHASLGYEYKLNSRLLIINPPATEGYYAACDYCEPELYVWTGKSFKKIE